MWIELKAIFVNSEVRLGLTRFIITITVIGRGCDGTSSSFLSYLWVTRAVV